MYFTYGSYTHPSNEVNIVSMTKHTHLSSRRKTMYKTIRMTLQGCLIASTQATIEAKIDALLDAYLEPNQDAALYQDDGTATSHVLESSTTIDGVKVISVDFPTGAPGEFATGRNYRIVLEAQINAIEDEVVWYTETLTKIGTGGTIYAWIQVRNQIPVRQPIASFGPQTLIQSGQAIGYDAWVALPDSLYPAYELTHRRRTTHMSPQKICRNQWSMYPNSWRYIHVLPEGTFSVDRPSWL